MADHVVLDAVAVAVGEGTGAARIDSEVGGCTSFVLYRCYVNHNLPVPHAVQWYSLSVTCS